MQLRRTKLNRRFWAFLEDESNAPAGSTAEVVSTEPESVSAEVPNTVTSDPVQAPTIDWNDIIPEDLREKEHFKNILKAENPGVELAKQLDNAQTLIGKKTLIPGENATDEDWSKYYETVRPKEVSEYDIPLLDLGDEKKELADFINNNRDEEFLNGVREDFHAVGLTKKQAADLTVRYEKRQAALIEQQLQAQKDLDTHFEEITKSTFGGDEQKARDFGKQFIKDFASEKTAAYIKGLPNEALMVIADMAFGVHKKYEKGDAFNPGSSASSGQTLSEVSAEIQRLMKLPAYTNTFDGEHKATHEKVDALVSRKIALQQGK